MKAARLYSFDDIRIEEVPVPEPGPEEALVRTRASGICSGDAMRWYIEGKAPLTLGHEPAGEIVSAGKDVKGFREGDRVFLHHHTPCQKCRYCQRGDYVQCDRWREPGIEPGGVAEYILVKPLTLRNDTLKLPDSVGFEEATMIEPLACVIKALWRAGIKRDTRALVIGLGVMGMLNVMALKYYRAETVIGADTVPYRLGRARELGADDVIDVSGTDLGQATMEKLGPGMADLVVVGPNSVEALEAGISCTGPGGTVLMFSPVRPGETLTIEPNELYFKDISIVPSYSAGPPDTRAALSLIKAGVINPSPLITHRFGIEQTAEALRTVAQAEESLKCIIVF